MYYHENPYRAAGPDDKLFRLEDFLVDPKRDYQDLVNRATEFLRWGLHAPNQLTFADAWTMEAKKDGTLLCTELEYDELLHQKIKGSLLLDLGGAKGYLEGFAVNMGAAVYINVDLEPEGYRKINSLCPHTNLTLPEFAFWEKTQRISVKADMLDFLSRVPDSSCNITINGIDDYIIDHWGYHPALAKEIKRVVKPDGIICGYNSNCFDYFDTTDATFERLEPQKDRYISGCNFFFLFEARKPACTHAAPLALTSPTA